MNKSIGHYQTKATYIIFKKKHAWQLNAICDSEQAPELWNFFPCIMNDTSGATDKEVWIKSTDLKQKMCNAKWTWTWFGHSASHLTGWHIKTQ